MIHTRNLSLLLLAVLSSPAIPHHGFGSFALDEDIELTGVITNVDFVNPHSWVYFDVRNEQGEVESWRCEMRAATVLRRSGWSKELFVNGDSISITGSPDRNDARSCYLSSVLFADGSSAERYGQLEFNTMLEDIGTREIRLPNGDLNISGDWAPEQIVMTDPRGQSGALVPLSVARGEAEAQGGNPWATSTVNFTQAGQQAADNFGLRSGDNPRMRCATTSIIFDWNFDGPVNRISQNESTILMEYGRYGFTRTVYMELDTHPSDLPLSLAGHSIGHWQDDVLIVDTVAFMPGVLSPPVMNSDQLHVVERFALDTENFVLSREYVGTDNTYYTDQYIGSDTMYIADIAYSPDECKELTFVDFDANIEESETNSESPWWQFWN